MFLLDAYYLSITALVTLGWQLSFALYATASKSDKVTDLCFGTNFAVLVILTLFLGQTFYVRQIVVTSLVVVWGLRLAGYLFYRINKIGKDKRFDEVRGHCVRFSIWFLFQFISIWLMATPQVILNAEKSNPDIGALDIVGWSIWAIGFFFESVGDHQKFVFRSNPNNKAKWCDVGLWKLSRHPNYFGEICCWWGCFLSCASVLSSWRWFSIVGPVFITVCLLFLSGIPTTEKSSDTRCGSIPEYQEYKQRTPILIPFFPGIFSGTWKVIFCCEWGIYSHNPEEGNMVEENS